MRRLRIACREPSIDSVASIASSASAMSLPPAYSSTKRRYARMATESGRGGRPRLATAAQRHDLGVVAAFHERRDFIAEPAPVRPDTLAGQRDVAGRHGD